jgi:murein DD-endopeptidase MepM/ murein hydrolase activator NlpD
MNTTKFNQFLNQISEASLFVIDANIPLDAYEAIDISKKNEALLNFDTSSSEAWEKYMESYLKTNKKEVAFGGYLEQRNLYDRSTYFKKVAENEKRNIHLGTDLWCKENTLVLAVLAGEIHSFKNNMNHGDYGPTVILKHVIATETFYSLYGHLSKESIENMKIGTVFLQGQVLGTLGAAEVNGDYAPHLHFQIIRNLEDNFGDYPGVASQQNISFYEGNCPNPNLLLKLAVPS